MFFRRTGFGFQPNEESFLGADWETGFCAFDAGAVGNHELPVQRPNSSLTSSNVWTRSLLFHLRGTDGLRVGLRT